MITPHLSLSIHRNAVGQVAIAQYPLKTGMERFWIIRRKAQNLLAFGKQRVIERMIRHVIGEHRTTGGHALVHTTAIELCQTWQIHNSGPLLKLRHPLSKFTFAHLLQHGDIVCDLVCRHGRRGGPAPDCRSLQLVEPDLITSRWRAGPHKRHVCLQPCVFYPGPSRAVWMAMEHTS